MAEVWGAAIAVAVGAGLTAWGASSAADSQADAAQKAADSQYWTNKMNEHLFHEARGASGYAFLPEYSKDASGNPIEPILMKDTYGLYNSFTSPDDQAATYRDILSRYAPLQAQAEKTASGIFDGSLEQEALDINAPVLEARRAVAASKKQSGIESLQSILNETRAIQQKRGFTGDSFGEHLTESDQRRKINTQFAEDSSNADLANATDTARIKGSAIGARLANMNLPYTMARQAVDVSNLPENASLDQQARRLQVFSPFRIGTSQFKYDPMPTAGPIASTGQILAQAGAGLAGSVGNLVAANALANQQSANMADMARLQGGANFHP